MKYVVQILVAAAAVVGVILVLDRYGKKWLKKIQDCRCRIFGEDNTYDEDDFKIAICNSRGLDLSYENSLSGLVMAGVVSDGTEMACSRERS